MIDFYDFYEFPNSLIDQLTNYLINQSAVRYALFPKRS